MAAKAPNRTAASLHKSLPNHDEQPDPTDLSKLKVAALHKRRGMGKLQREGKGFMPVAKATALWLLARTMTFKPVRTVQLYASRRGPLMAAGISYNLFFAVAAMLVAGFSILGLVASGNRELQELVISGVDRQVPNLIGTGGEGMVSPQQLFKTGGSLSIALVISTATMLWTSLRWIGSLREGMRGIFDLAPIEANPVIVKLKDLGILVILAVAMLVTLGVGIVVNTLLDTIVDLFNLGTLAGFFTRVAGLSVMLLLDMVVAVILFRFSSRIRMLRLAMFQSALIAAVGSTLLRTFSTLLLGSVGNNPLLDPFAVILGLFVWFFLLSQVYLVAASWGAISKADTVAALRHRGKEDKLPSLRQRAREAEHR
ncbi:YihY/virulence factor BrkB family protein [Arthrobacter sp. H14]|uniref:YihY/virulence factor BrkB family protein n=1 Tax=Arthrobacter sp. H14 TaxID=1312959 RepID=UPI0004ADCE98|nr:YihY/virulence factor BrkB family protein [Arthrobacter sp. H14]